MLSLGFLLVAAAPVTNPSATPYSDVKVGSATLRIPVPKGYCFPVRDEVARFQKLAAPDNRNKTLLSLVDCQRNAASERYLLVKAPLETLDVPLELGEFMKEMTAAVDDPGFDSFLQGLPEEVGKAKTKASGVPTKLLPGNFSERGNDDVCVYMGGTMTTIKGGKSQNQSVGACLTVLGSRIVTLYSYVDSKDPGAYISILPKLKLWALQIRSAQPERR